VQTQIFYGNTWITEDHGPVRESELQGGYTDYQRLLCRGEVSLV